MSVKQGRRCSFLTEDEKANKPKITKELIKRIVWNLKPYVKQMSLIIFIIVISSILTILPSLLTGKIIDDGFIKRDLKTLIFLIGLSVVVTLLGNLIGLVECYLNTWFLRILRLI